MSKLISKFLILSVYLTSLSHFGCASKEEAKAWSPEIDQSIRDSSGRITFARIHYVVAKTKPMNRVRKNKVLALMRNACPNKEFSLIRSYKTESDFVTLKFDYRGNVPVFIYEFKCKN